MLPGADGSEVLHEIRKAHDMPVIVVSAKGSVQHKVDLLKAGADDYMTKPFSLEELEARIRAQLRRRGHRPVDTTLRCGTLSLLDDQRTLMIEDRRITLTRHEYRIMELLMQSPGRAFSKREIYECAWEDVFCGRRQDRRGPHQQYPRKMRQERLDRDRLGDRIPAESGRKVRSLLKWYP